MPYELEVCVPVGLAAYQGKPIKAYEIIGSALDPAATVSKKVLTVSRLLSPLSNEEIKVVRCLGLNYSDHAVSSNIRLNIPSCANHAEQAEAKMAKPA